MPTQSAFDWPALKIEAKLTMREFTFNDSISESRSKRLFARPQLKDVKECDLTR
ncbi:MAG: hypothetical protein AB7K24_22575 [Gemmataceae bacterium]